MHDRESAREILSPGRRLFLKAAVGVGAVAVFDGWRSLEAVSDTQDDGFSPEEGFKVEPNSDNPIESFVHKIDNHLKTQNGVQDTIEDGLTATAFAAGYSLVTNNRWVRLWSGNSQTKKMLKEYRKNRAKVIKGAVVMAPVVEETIFRALPAILGKKGRIMPVRGIISTYLFGKAHQVTSKTENGKKEVKIDPNRVPVQQYGLGALFWMIARRRGIKHAAIAHATVNATVVGMIDVMSRLDKDGPSEVIGSE